MSSTFKRGARLSAIGAAAALAAGGLMVAPAAAEEGATETATLDEIAAQAKSIDGVVKILQDGDGVITVTTESEEGEGGFTAAAADTLSALDATYSNVEIDHGGDAFVAKASNEVVGGHGIVYPTADGGAAVCSVGFSAWSSQGDPAVVTAGHCADGASGEVNLSVPSSDDAVGNEEPAYTPDIGAPLGQYGFYQYGGPGDSLGEDGDETSTDIAVIDNINSDLTLLPEVTDWTTQAEDDLAASTVSVTSVGKAAIDEEIQRSGRTTGFETGVVVDEGWAQVSGHWVYGFAAEPVGEETFVLGGDSGGAVMQGNTAVGIVSGGSEAGDFLFYADLQTALNVTDGYTVALDIAEPAVEKATAERGTQFTGTAPAGSEVTIAGDIEAEVTADDNGEFTFPAPNEVGTFDITLTAKQGFDVSEKVNETVETTQIQLDAPAITSPENDSTSKKPVTEITGTGHPGAEVTLDGDAEGTATVDEDGNWSVEVDLGIGAYTVGVTQSVGEQTSESSEVSFKVVPGSPSITSPENESSSTQPVTTIDGSGKPGAEVTLTGDAEGTATVDEDGNWSVDVDLGIGAYTVAVTQSVNGQTSESSQVSFQVVPGAPTIVTPEDGGTYEEGMIPAITGESPNNGATVKLDLDGPEAAQATLEALRAAGDAEVVGGVWSVELQEQLVPGEYTIAATQSINGVTSDSSSVTFEVVAAGGGGGDEGDGDEGNGDGGDDNDLAPTGADTASTVLPLAGGAAVILLAGATLLVVRRVTRA